ncbi:MAG: YeeE/YedE thiosulfate transporter family protein [Acholeplasmataceae bacterium]|nr:YeeE/YedE family protein [Acholeplasmataceae bacterium]
MKKFFLGINEFFNKLKSKDLYKRLFVNPFTYITGAVLLALFNIVTFAATGKGWGVTGVLSLWGAWIVKPFANIATWANLSDATIEAGFFQSGVSVRNLGIILGALLAVLLASQFKIKKIKSWRQVIAATLGGLLMGYGARVALGCNIGALFTGIASLSLAGWVFFAFLFIGAMVGSKLLVKYFM